MGQHISNLAENFLARLNAAAASAPAAPAFRPDPGSPPPWEKIPDDYKSASREGMEWAKAALQWDPKKNTVLAIWGPVGQGKSSAAAVVAIESGRYVEWANGYKARDLYNAYSRGEYSKEWMQTPPWMRLFRAPLLVLDDIDKGTFTAAWLAALYGLIEHRVSNKLPFIWTANYGPGELARKFRGSGIDGDPETADAIERRLLQHAFKVHP